MNLRGFLYILRLLVTILTTLLAQQIRYRLADRYSKIYSIFKYIGTFESLFKHNIKIFYLLRITCGVQFSDFLLHVTLTATRDHHVSTGPPGF
jgi:hypothetical protein